MYLLQIWGNTDWDCIHQRPGTMSVNNFRFFTNISKILLSTNMYNISLERSIYSAFARVCCIKLHAEIKELLQVKD